MRRQYAFPVGTVGLVGAALLVFPAQPVQAFSAKPDDAQGAKVVGHLMATNFTKQCDVNTYPLQKNLSYLFDNKYIGLKFQSWEVLAQGEERFRVVLHYVDGEAGPTTARWEVDLAAQESRMQGESAEVLSCMTGYL